MTTSLFRESKVRPLLWRTRRPSDVRRVLGIDTVTRRVLVGGAVPVWLGMGIGDWWCHRRSHIETTTGLHEAAIHWLLPAQSGMPIILGLFCEVNAGVLAASSLSAVTHTATGYWDIAYADQRRRVTPLEQLMHAGLASMPVAITAALAILHWDQAQSLIRRGPVQPDFRLRLRRPALATQRTRGVVLSAIVLGFVLPYGEEIWRCAHADVSAKEELPGSAYPGESSEEQPSDA
ncbi:hypothetical protein ACGFNU_15800 [Spirillospora sp. NPDC048911]|uniref:hypothetical protein n=1 Tax=Spirillospora sp. NPDC048911 TaxID=3364527 RepID=UPI0037106B71